MAPTKDKQRLVQPSFGDVHHGERSEKGDNLSNDLLQNHCSNYGTCAKQQLLPGVQSDESGIPTASSTARPAESKVHISALDITSGTGCSDQHSVKTENGKSLAVSENYFDQSKLASNVIEQPTFDSFNYLETRQQEEIVKSKGSTNENRTFQEEGNNNSSYLRVNVTHAGKNGVKYDKEECPPSPAILTIVTSITPDSPLSGEGKRLIDTCIYDQYNNHFTECRSHARIDDSSKSNNEDVSTKYSHGHKEFDNLNHKNIDPSHVDEAVIPTEGDTFRTADIPHIVQTITKLPLQSESLSDKLDSLITDYVSPLEKFQGSVTSASPSDDVNETRIDVVKAESSQKQKRNKQQNNTTGSSLTRVNNINLQKHKSDRSGFVGVNTASKTASTISDKNSITSSSDKSNNKSNNNSNNSSNKKNTAPKRLPSSGKKSVHNRSGSDSEYLPLVPVEPKFNKGSQEKERETMGNKDEEGSRFFVYYLSCFATIGGLLFGYDTGIVSGAMLQIGDYFNLTTIWKEIIVSGTVGAAAIFALFAGFTCDYLGRKITIMMASVVFAIGAVVMGASDSKEMLLGGRIIVGVGIGFASMTVPVYVAEAAPPDIRGRLVSLNQLFITIGILISSLVAGGFSEMEETGWRYMLGLACVPGVIQFLGFIFLPESPRWLVTKGKEDKAREVLRKIRSKENVEEEMDEIKRAVEDNKKESGFVLGRILRTPHVRKALFVGCVLQMFQQLCGINTVIYYSATILKMAGFPAKQAIWLVTIPFSINFIFTILGVLLVERLGRKKLLLISFIGVAVALVVLAVGFQLSATFSPKIDRNVTETYSNGTGLLAECYVKTYSTCEDCILNEDCGYCYVDDSDIGGSCLPINDDKEDEYAANGRCSRGNINTAGTTWAHGYCPTSYTWMAVVGLTLFVMAFAPGLGPMPWTINSEIYPLWARGTANALATGCNWVCNLVVSLFFLTLTETITKYGAFWLFCGVCFLGFIFTATFVPETKNKSLEEVERLFMGGAGVEPSGFGSLENGAYEKEISVDESQEKSQTNF